MFFIEIKKIIAIINITKFFIKYLIFAKIAIEFCKDKEINSLSRKKLIEFTTSIRKIILTNWLRILGVKRVSALQIEEINTKISQTNPPGTIHLHGDFLIRWDKENIYISNKVKEKKALFNF